MSARLYVALTPQERAMFQAWQRATTMPMGRVRRGRMLLLLDAGESVSQVARVVGIQRRFVYKWVQRFHREGIAGLDDKPGRGLARRRGQVGAEEL